jgi:hypothetical protein
MKQPPNKELTWGSMVWLYLDLVLIRRLFANYIHCQFLIHSRQGHSLFCRIDTLLELFVHPPNTPRSGIKGQAISGSLDIREYN